MARFNSISDSLAGRAAMLGGAAFAAGGVITLIHSQRDAGSRVIGLTGHLVLSFFVVAMIGIAPSLVALARRARPGVAQKAGAVAAAGTTVLGLTTITSIVNGRDLGLFTIVAPLTNAAWLFGSVIIAASLRRSRTVAPATAIGPTARLAGCTSPVDVGRRLRRRCLLHDHRLHAFNQWSQLASPPRRTPGQFRQFLSGAREARQGRLTSG
jgi:hypothetical protein